MLSLGITYSLCWFVALVYPTYASYKALGTAATYDDSQWLTYWVVYSFLSSLEVVIQTFFQWMPFYYEIKLLFVLWLILPQTKGAQFIFDEYIRPLMLKYGRNIDPAFASAEKLMFSQQTAMIVELARKHGTEVARLAVQRAVEEAPRLAAATAGSGTEAFPSVPTHRPGSQPQSQGSYVSHNSGRGRGLPATVRASTSL